MLIFHYNIQILYKFIFDVIFNITYFRTNHYNEKLAGKHLHLKNGGKGGDRRDAHIKIC